MGASAACCREASKAWPEQVLGGDPATSSGSSRSRSSSSASAEEGLDFSKIDTRKPVQEVLREWLPLHEERVQRCHAVEWEAQEEEAEVVALRHRLAAEANQEAASAAAARQLRTELQAAQADELQEAERHQSLAEEVHERGRRSAELRESLESQAQQHWDVKTDVAKLNFDLDRLRREAVWARRYLGQAEMRRGLLESEFTQEVKARREARGIGVIAGQLGIGFLRTELQDAKKAEAIEQREADKHNLAEEALAQRRDQLKKELWRGEQEVMLLEKRAMDVQHDLADTRGRREWIDSARGKNYHYVRPEGLVHHTPVDSSSSSSSISSVSSVAASRKRPEY